MRAWLFALPFLLLVLPATVAQDTTVFPEPFEFPPCDVPEPVLFAQLDTDLENMEFDGNGSLFLTAFGDGLYRLDSNGTVEHVASSDRTRDQTESATNTVSTAFMGVTLGADGALYVAEGHTLTKETEGRVLRFDEPGNASFEVFAEGFPNTNGLASDDAGNLYLAHGFRDELWKIGPDGEWSVWTRVPDAVNGVVEHPDGERLVIAPLGDPANAVYAIPYDRPDEREPLFRFNAAPSASGGVGPDAERPLHQKGIDDLSVAPDGRILVTAHLRMQYVMGDPETGEACVLLDGARAEPSSIRVAHGFGDWDGWAFTTDFAGDVWAIDIRGDDTATGQMPQNHTQEEEAAARSTPASSAWALVVSVSVLVASWRRRIV